MAPRTRPSPGLVLQAAVHTSLSTTCLQATKLQRCPRGQTTSNHRGSVKVNPTRLLCICGHPYRNPLSKTVHSPPTSDANFSLLPDHPGPTPALHIPSGTALLYDHTALWQWVASCPLVCPAGATCRAQTQQKNEPNAQNTIFIYSPTRKWQSQPLQTLLLCKCLASEAACAAGRPPQKSLTIS